MEYHPPASLYFNPVENPCSLIKSDAYCNEKLYWSKDDFRETIKMLQERTNSLHTSDGLKAIEEETTAPKCKFVQLY